jgi:hypothetical protein
VRHAEVELAERRVVTADDGLIVLVDEQRRRAEDNEVEVEYGHAVVEVALAMT